MTNDLNALKRETIYRFSDKIIVFGEGPSNAKLVLIGEAPGESEEKEGRPFVGKAGKNLNEFLEISGIQRNELYITNAVKFRPTASGKSGGKINRKPTDAEIEAFRPILIDELRLISPKVVATLGATALYALTGEKPKIGDAHGKFIEKGGYTLFPMYHPASVIYNRSLKDIYIADVKTLGKWMRENV